MRRRLHRSVAHFHRGGLHSRRDRPAPLGHRYSPAAAPAPPLAAFRTSAPPICNFHRDRRPLLGRPRDQFELSKEAGALPLRSLDVHVVRDCSRGLDREAHSLGLGRQRRILSGAILLADGAGSGSPDHRVHEPLDDLFRPAHDGGRLAGSLSVPRADHAGRLLDR